MIRKKGQSFGEYAVVVALVSAAVLGMTVYVRRGIQARLKGVNDYAVLRIQATSELTKEKFPSYGPEQPTLREQMAAFLVRALGLVTSKYNPDDPSTWAVDLDDVPTDNQFWASIQAIFEAGITRGTGINPETGKVQFNPGDTLTRSQAAVMFARALRLDTSQYNPNDPSTWAWDFADADIDPSTPGLQPCFGWAQIQAVYAAGIISGTTDTTYEPSEVLRRDQMAVILYRAFKDRRGLTLYNGFQIFNDVSPDDFAYGESGALYLARITYGIIGPDGRPDLQYEPGYEKSYRELDTNTTVREIHGRRGIVIKRGPGAVPIFSEQSTSKSAQRMEPFAEETGR